MLYRRITAGFLPDLMQKSPRGDPTMDLGLLGRRLKLKEFYCKLLHGILPCNKYLMKWKIKMNDECDVCQREQSIKHLLFGCIYVKPLWKVVEKICDFEITFDKILGTEECHSQDRILTLISFLIYEEWLLFSLAGKRRNSKIMLDVYKNELALRLKIYEASCYVVLNSALC